MEDDVQAKGSGIFLVIALLVGLFLGLRAGEPSLGLLIGLAVGVVVAFALNLLDARRMRRR